MKGFSRPNVAAKPKFTYQQKCTQLFRAIRVESSAEMKLEIHQPEEAWESDPVWKLIDDAAAPKASARFAEKTLRAARTSTQNTVWWKSLFGQTPLAGLGAAAALTALAIAFFPSSDNTPFHEDALLVQETEEIAEMENLLTSIDHIEELSDSELIALIGY